MYSFLVPYCWLAVFLVTFSSAIFFLATFLRGRKIFSTRRKKLSVALGVILLLAALFSTIQFTYAVKYVHQKFCQDWLYAVPFDYSTFMEKVNRGEVQEVTIMENNIAGKLKNETRFRTYIPYKGPNFTETLQTKGVRIMSKPVTTKWDPPLLIHVSLPILRGIRQIIGYFVGAIIAYLLIVRIWKFLRPIEPTERKKPKGPKEGESHKTGGPES